MQVGAIKQNPGVRPIGIGEVLRRIIGHTITKCVSQDLVQLGCNMQLCFGEKSGIESAIHSFSEKHGKSDTEALLLDADNTFNSLIRELAMKKCEILCPALYHAIYNSYSKPSALFVNRKKLMSREGTTRQPPGYGNVWYRSSFTN